MLVPWSRGMISRLQREDHEFESRRNHFLTIFKAFFKIIIKVRRVYKFYSILTI